MKALICALNTKYVHSSLAPWCLLAGVREYAPECECRVVEGTINEEEESILNKILENDFEIIGFCTYIWNVQMVLSLAEKIKKRTKATVVLGGPEVSYNSREILLKNPFIDLVILGEGERPFAELCVGKAYPEIGGLAYKMGGEVVENEPYEPLENPPSPYTQEYFSSLGGRISYIETSRGCPYRCAFCLSGRCGGVRFFDIDEAKANILALAKSGSKTIKFIDRTFNADKKRAKELFAFIIDNYGDEIPNGVCFHFEIEGDILDDELICLLSSAPLGSIQLEIGLQSFNESTLRAINRKPNTKRLCENIKKLLKPQNIHIHIDLIAGLPYEDMQSIEESFNRAIALAPHMLQLGFLKLLHGSELRNKAEDYEIEYSRSAPYEVKSTKWLTKAELEALHITEDFFDRFYNSGRFLLTTNYIYEKIENPFKLYTELGVFVNERQQNRSLDELSRLVYEYLCARPELDGERVRDCMALDRLATNREGSLPEHLRIRTPELRKYLNMLEENVETRAKKGVKRAITIMKSEPCAVYVDYDRKNPVTNRYNLKQIKF